MAGSGVAVDDEVNTVLRDVQMNHKFKYVIMRLTEDLTRIVVDKKAGKTATYDEFVADLQEAEKKDECRYAIYDYSYQTKSGAAKEKLAFVAWSPDGAKVKQKMLYASSKDALKKSLGTAIGVHIQATDYDEISEEKMLQEITKFEKA